MYNAIFVIIKIGRITAVCGTPGVSNKLNKILISDCKHQSGFPGLIDNDVLVGLVTFWGQ